LIPILPLFAHLVNLLPGWCQDGLLGAIDVAPDVIETPQEVAATLREALCYVAPAQLYPCPNCGMVPLTRQVARAKMRALVAGTALVRQEVGQP
jgi:5-methyltetrahydropteroyltriglutamate--homocysteine methyltransferase